uniref:Ig-like domain-containing protein n=1 Tax=Gopherus evgoodei TaxID=1825980 RepID=A0A8C4Y455_9SAUR
MFTVRAAHSQPLLHPPSQGLGNVGLVRFMPGRGGGLSPPCLTPVLLRAGQEFLKPTIWVSPIRVVALGGNVTIRCEGQDLGMEFVLRKAGHPNPQVWTMLPDGTGAELLIPGVGREDGGSYTCNYRSTMEPSRSSYPSDPVEIIVGGEGPGLPAPHPARPTRGLCSDGMLRARGPGAAQPALPTPLETQYSVGSCSGEGPVAGSLCRPLPARGPRLTACLLPAAEPSYPKPSISGIPSKGVSLGESVSIWCKGQHRGVRFVLNKDGRHFPPVDSDGFGAVFAISNVSREDGGSYSCSYHSRSEPFAVSYPSNPVELVVRAQPPARPSRGSLPMGRSEPGSALSPDPTEGMPGRGAGTESLGSPFRIPSVGRQQEGNYSCSYRLRSEPFVSSQPSEPVKLVVAGEGPGSTSPLPARSSPGIGQPGAGVAQASWRDWDWPGWDWAQLAGMAGVQVGWLAAADLGLGLCRGFWGLGAAQLALPTPLEAQHSMGSCAGWGPVAGSPCRPLPAQGLRLTTCLLLLPEPTLPNPSFHPSREVSLGGSVSVRCQGLHPGVRFVLNKGGRHVAHVDTERLEFVFPINNVQREQGGNYSCSHHSRSEPFTEWSDPVELVVRGEGPAPPNPTSPWAPARGVTLGGAATVRCQGQCWGLEFALYKAGARNAAARSRDSAGVKFPILKVSQAEGGSYTGYYPSSLDPDTWSEPSDTVQLVVAGEGPSSASSLPAPPPPPASPTGGAVSVWCWGQHQGVRFMLNKEGRHVRTVDSDGSEVVFYISNMSREDGGNYSCSYHSRSEPFAVSYPSDPMELVPSYPKPNISGIPSGGLSLGAAVTIWCRGQHRGVRFVLNKEGRHYPPVDSDGFEAVFPISNVSREDGGNYSCSYHSRSKPFAVSYPSDPVELVVRGEGPGSASPVPAPPPSGHCQQIKGCDHSPLFSIGEETLPAGPLYCPCHWGQAVWTGRSDCAGICLTACLLLPAELRYPKSNISLRPSGGVAQGEAVTVWCVCQCLGVRFLLRKGGAMAAHRTTAPAVDVVEFPICNVRRGDAGSYCCRYRTKWDPLISSEPSDPMELAGEGSGLASLLPAPHPSGPSGGLRASLGCWYYPTPPSPWFDTAPAGRQAPL